jgi:parvulin-like peptidyl-prolyl isomerase
MRPLRILAVLLLCAASPLRAELVNGIKAVVHDSVVTHQDVAQLTEQTADVLRRDYYNQPAEYNRRLLEADSQNLDKLMRKELILHEFSTAGYKYPESVIEDAVKADLKERYGDRVTATKTLQARGITYEKYREQVRQRIIVSAMRDKNVSSSVVISPHKVEVYYLAHKNEYQVEDQVKLRMIVLNKARPSDSPPADKLAGEILGKIKEGASFEEMARIYSDGPQRARGGSWDWVERSVLRKELADIAFSLKPGQHSDVVEIPDAYYIMLVDDARPAHTKPLVEVREQVERVLTLAEQKRLEDQWIDKLRKKTFTRTF